MIRLRGKWTKVTPDQYDATMDCEVNPAIGRGSDQDRITMLMGIKQTQEAIIQSQGANNPMVSPMEYRNTLEDIMSLSGMKNVSRYFKPITPEQLQAALKAQSEKPDPNMVLAQAEADKVRAQIVKTLTDAKVKVVQMGLEDDLGRDELDAKIAIEGAKMEATGAQLDQDAVQLAIDATRPETAKADTKSIPEPEPPAPIQPEAPVGPPTNVVPLIRPPGHLPPKLDLPPGFGQR